MNTTEHEAASKLVRRASTLGIPRFVPSGPVSPPPRVYCRSELYYGTSALKNLWVSDSANTSFIPSGTCTRYLV